MKSYDYPPLLDQVLQYAPKAAFLYVRLWRNRNASNELSLYKEMIAEEMLLSWKTFQNDLMLLKREKVLNFSINKKNKINIKFFSSINEEKVA